MPPPRLAGRSASQLNGPAESRAWPLASTARTAGVVLADCGSLTDCRVVSSMTEELIAYPLEVAV